MYIVRCHNGALYTGVTTDVARRMREHNAGRGARYTRLNRPVRLVYLETATSRSDALRRELAIKALKRAAKLELLHSGCNEAVGEGRVGAA